MCIKYTIFIDFYNIYVCLPNTAGPKCQLFVLMKFVIRPYTRLLHTDILLLGNCARRVDVIFGCRKLKFSRSVDPEMDDDIAHNIMD